MGQYCDSKDLKGFQQRFRKCVQSSTVPIAKDFKLQVTEEIANTESACLKSALDGNCPNHDIDALYNAYYECNSLANECQQKLISGYCQTRNFEAFQEEYVKCVNLFGNPKVKFASNLKEQLDSVCDKSGHF